MGICLYEHNRIAYESAVAMLKEYNKAAIIHPTGTGKSYIGLKLCEDNPHKKICWLSPSEYIFKTQIENTKKDNPEFNTDNITFITYAKLMLMDEQELGTVMPDYIILDEFHRCGATEWGAGAQRLISLFPQSAILGLSATAIRYLDNQRNMADELFDGKIASEISLGEAIVRGILNPPKYVLSVFPHLNDLEKYEARIKKAKSKAVKDLAEKYLEELRRALDQADGMDKIFAKHMTDFTGKYIVFCAGYEHMQEMIEKSYEWFSEIDKDPHIYSAYSNDPDTDKAFANFKADNSNHLKLLFCIDMLNEGIHVDDISGVILLRPTISPIIYKQQIGRTLSANKSKDVVIFDIVLNIENLYSIGGIEDEINMTIAYYRALDKEDRIINDKFPVIDELKDCLELFDKLNETLSASWDLMYLQAKKYYTKHGNLQVPSRYRTEDGYSLGSWVCTQRNMKKGLIKSTLTDEKIKKLEEIGMIWENISDLNWSKNFQAAKNYFDKNGNLDVPCSYTTKDGIPLGLWLSSLRTWEKAGVYPKYLSSERKQQLEEIGMIWDKLDFLWEKNYMAAAEYYRQHRNLDVPVSYITNDGLKLGLWINRIRALNCGRGKGTPPSTEQIRRLDEIGMIWDMSIDYKWKKAFNAAKKYAEENGNLMIPVKYISPDGIRLGTWLQNQRALYKKGQLQPERLEKLNSIDTPWLTESSWDRHYESVKEHYEKNGNLNISQSTVYNGMWIGKWLVRQKKLYLSGDKLTTAQRTLLSQLPIHQIDNSKNKQSLYV